MHPKLNPFFKPKSKPLYRMTLYDTGGRQVGVPITLANFSLKQAKDEVNTTVKYNNFEHSQPFHSAVLTDPVTGEVLYEKSK